MQRATTLSVVTHSPVRFALANEIEPKAFEMLSVALMGREGFLDIVPGGGHHDRGRDAEVIYWEGTRGPTLRVAFQFSLEKKWEQKLRRDSAKIFSYSTSVNTLVYVTNRIVSKTKSDALAVEFKKTFNRNLMVYDGDWLCYMLEEVHHDLAKKYLGVSLPDTLGNATMQIRLHGLSDENADTIFAKIPPETVKASTLARTKSDPNNWSNWKTLAQIEYHLSNFEAALHAINTALGICPEDWNLQLYKAAILAELGIQKQSRALMLQAKEVLSRVSNTLGRPSDHYNLANVLGPLGEYQEAERHYRLALVGAPDDPRIWKNLGSVLFHKGDHVEEMKCYEKALALNPKMAEAHLSKASTFILALNKPEEAIKCFRLACDSDPEVHDKWRYSRYWHSEALARIQKLDESLQQVDLGLLRYPDDEYYLNQKSKLLMFLWPNSDRYAQDALEFYSLRASSRIDDYFSLFQIVQIRLKLGIAEGSWGLIQSCIQAGQLDLRELADWSSFTWRDIADGFRESKAYIAFRKDTGLTRYFVHMREAGLDPNPQMELGLRAALMFSFGKLLQAMRELSTNPAPSQLRKSFENCLKDVAKIMAHFAPAWLSRSPPASKEQLVDYMVKIAQHLPDIIVAEAASQYGFCLGILKISGSTSLQNDQNWSNLRNDVLDLVLPAIQKEWHCFGTSATGNS